MSFPLYIIYEYPILFLYRTKLIFLAEEMAFMFSKAETSSFPGDSEKSDLKHSEENDYITRQVCLRSSTRNSTEALDKQIVLKRIRHHKYLSKLKSTFQALVTNDGSEQANTVAVHQHRWLDHDDAFSSP